MSAETFDIKTYPQYFNELFRLAWPMIMGNLGMILIGAGDVFVAARYSTNALASISIGNSIIVCFFIFGIGIMASISPLLSNFRGERNSIKKYFLPTINFSMVLAFVTFFMVLFCIPVIDKIGFSPVLVPDIKKYMLICSFSVFGAYLQAGLKEYLQAFEIVMFPNFLNIIGVFIHLFLDFVFVFGLFGVPAMGAVGLAVATLLSRTLFGLILLVYCLKFIKVRYYQDVKYFVNLLKIGLPIAVAIVLEFAAFYLITLFVGRISGLYAASQSILITITTATFMIPLAISNAIAIKVGFSNGACNYVDLKRYAICGTLISVGFMSVCALCFLTFPAFFVKIFTSDPGLIKICVPILILAGFFQIFDGLQVSLGGVFKGLKKTKIVMLGDFLAYWIIGIPLGLILGLKYKMDLYGFWIGLTAAILTLSMILLFILIKKLKTIKNS